MKKQFPKTYQFLEADFQDLTVKWVPQYQDLPPDMLTESEKFWEKVKNKKMYNGKLARLDSWSVKNNILNLNLSITDYRTLIYSNHHIQHVIETWGEKYISRALGISAVVLTSDHFLMLMRRSDLVGEYPECIDVFGGHINISNDSDFPGVHEAMLQELEEELGLMPDEIDLQCIGLLKNNQNHKPELIFTAHIALTVNQVINKSYHAVDRFEFSKIIILPHMEQVLTSFLKKNELLFTPSALGSINIYKQSGSQIPL